MTGLWSGRDRGHIFCWFNIQWLVGFWWYLGGLCWQWWGVWYRDLFLLGGYRPWRCLSLRTNSITFFIIVIIFIVIYGRKKDLLIKYVVRWQQTCVRRGFGLVYPWWILCWVLLFFPDWSLQKNDPCSHSHALLFPNETHFCLLLFWETIKTTLLRNKSGNTSDTWNTFMMILAILTVVGVALHSVGKNFWFFEHIRYIQHIYIQVC